MNINRILKLIITFLVCAIVVLSMMLIYNNYHNRYTLQLIGPKTQEMYLYEEYREFGYQAYDRDGNDVTNQVSVINNVDPTQEGTYTIVYKIGRMTEERTVIVKYDHLKDIEIGLNGTDVVYSLKGSEYYDSGAYAYDLVDKDITNKISVVNNVDTSVVGEYSVVYTIVNSRGYSKEVSRKVIVYDVEYELDEGILDNEYVITFNFTNDYYSQIKLPDGSISTNKQVTYKVNQNGDVVFEIYDIYENIIRKEIKISGLDTEKPTGSCSVYLYETSSVIEVIATDDSGISGYVYKYGSETSSKMTNNKFTYYTNTSKASVVIYDNYNKTTEVTCRIVDNSSKYTRSYTENKGSYPYMLYVPSTLSSRNKLPLVVFLHGSSEAGGNLSKLNNNSFPKYISQGKNYDFVMIAPQMSTYERDDGGWEASRIMKVINDVLAKYPIDRNRIIVTGFSLGGIGTYRVIKQYPGFFAGAIPVAGTNSYDSSLLKTKIWAFHGSEDRSVKYSSAKSTMDKVIAQNPDSKFTTFQGYGHNITELVYTDQKVIDWIMSVYKY